MQKRVKVKSNCKTSKIFEEEDLKSPPVDGKANEEFIKTLADKYNVPKS